jgi:hypothetical protein
LRLSPPPAALAAEKIVSAISIFKLSLTQAFLRGSYGNTVSRSASSASEFSLSPATVCANKFRSNRKLRIIDPDANVVAPATLITFREP